MVLPALASTAFVLLCFLVRRRWTVEDEAELSELRRREAAAAEAKHALVMVEIDRCFAEADADFKRKCDDLMRRVHDGTF